MFPSKTDRFTWVILIGAFVVQVGVGVWFMIQSRMIGFGAVAFIVAALVLWTLFGTYYVLNDAFLVIRCGPMRWRVRLDEIVQIVPTESLEKGPALSQDRLLIDYRRAGKRRSVMISPNDKEGFLRQLASAAPGLEVDGGRLTRRR